MINPQDLSDSIDNYLNSRMPEKERKDFEKIVAQDETLAAKVEEARAVNEAIYYASLAELKLTIGQDIKKIKYKPAFNWRNASYILIASTALISGITAYLIKDNKNSEPQKIESRNTINNSTQENNDLNSGKPQKNEKKFPYTSIPNKTQTQNTSIPDNKSLLESDLSNFPVQKNIAETKNTNLENKVLPLNNNISIKNTEGSSLKGPETVCDKSFRINVAASCKHQETGSIVILTDGSKEFIFQVDNHTTSGSKGVFQNLPSGEYEVLVNYNKECSYSKSITIEDKWCPLNSPFSFNPDYNEKWMVKYEHGASGRFTIFDIRGKEIFSSVFGSGNEQWNGTDMQGSVVQMGVYIGIVNYSDGRQEKVELTIVR